MKKYLIIFIAISIILAAFVTVVSAKDEEVYVTSGETNRNVRIDKCSFDNLDIDNISISGDNFKVLLKKDGRTRDVTSVTKLTTKGKLEKDSLIKYQSQNPFKVYLENRTLHFEYANPKNNQGTESTCEITITLPVARFDITIDSPNLDITVESGVNSNIDIKSSNLSFEDNGLNGKAVISTETGSISKLRGELDSNSKYIINKSGNIKVYKDVEITEGNIEFSTEKGSVYLERVSIEDYNFKLKSIKIENDFQDNVKDIFVKDKKVNMSITAVMGFINITKK